MNPKLASEQQVKISVDSAGVGGIVRSGSWAGFRLRLTDTAVRQRDVVVRLTMRDSDGDVPAFTRVVALNPGVAQPVWLYAWIPFGADRSSSFTISIFEAVEGGGIEAASAGTFGVLLAQAQIGAGFGTSTSFTIEEATTGLMARIGQKSLGLDRYVRSRAGERVPKLAHEPIDIAEMRTLADLPDAWMGLEPFDVLFWGTGEPGELRGAYARALREWILRGGHLVVVLPPAGQTWIGRTDHELADLMPEIDVNRRDGVDMTPYATLLSRAEDPRMPRDAVVYDFKPRDGASIGKAMRILNGPDGECVVVRRIVGSGAVTLVGFDLARDRMPCDADVFWHRVLGRRGQLLTPPEIAEIERTGRGGYIPQRTEAIMDNTIEGEISKGDRAAKGLLLGLVVFIAYWLVAGPGSYALLRKVGKLQHSWLAYLASAGAFTAVAWVGAWFIKPARTEASHVTLYEHVFGQEWTRARTWMNVMTPWYGEASVAVAGPDGKVETGARREIRNTLVPLDSMRQTGGADRPFPNTSEYSIESAFPGSLSYPARSTVKQLQADWVGGTLWQTPYPANEAGEPGGTITISPSTGRPLGILKHNLPGTLGDITIVHVPRQRTIRKSDVGVGALPLADSAWAVRLPAGARWAPGETLDLKKVFDMANENKIDSLAESYLTALSEAKLYGSGLVGTAEGGSFEQRMRAIAFFGQLTPPNARELTRVGERIQALRCATHNWDVSRWFTQPCVIIVAELKDAPTPTPLLIEGEPLASKGSTWIRWIYPLADDPPHFPTSASDSNSPPTSPTRPESPVEKGPG